MKINCLSCGHKLDLDETYNDYEGQIKCFVCGALLEIKSEDGAIKSQKFVKIVRPSVEEAMERKLG
ncbi:MAG: hypothetical protein P9X24_17405 [Candidatus Hatepunaea meridiana]|nr:hypothetical protein [Candidatus Hatepunaea meridiana]